MWYRDWGVYLLLSAAYKNDYKVKECLKFAMSILSIPEELFEYILLNINDREDILRVSRVCKLFNKFINTSKGMHLNNVYDTRFLCFGNVNNSWKSKVSTLCMKNIFNSKYETIRFKFETCIQKLVLTNIYIDVLDITNCILIKKLIVTNAVVKSIVGVDTAKELVKLDVSMSTFNNIKISSYLKNLNLNYTIIQSISIPVENSLVKFQAKNCNFNLDNDSVCLPLSYSKLVTFSIKSTGVWDTTFGSTALCQLGSINSICIDNSSVTNLYFLNGCSNKLKCLEISNSRIKNMEKIQGYVYSVQNICLRENKIHNFDFIKKYKELVSLEIIETTNKYASEFIHELENLKKLRLTGDIIFNIKNINSKAPLEVLYLDIYILENIKLIAGFKEHLKKLNISAYDYLVIEPISECINLVKLRINHKRFSSIELSPLIKLDKLKVLDMNGVFLKMKQLVVFNEMANLKLVNLPIKFYYKIKSSDKIRYSFKEHWIGFSKKKHVYYRKECNEIRLLLT